MPFEYKTVDGLKVVETTEADNEVLNEMILRLGMKSGHILQRLDNKTNDENTKSR